MTFAFFPAVDLRGGKCVQLIGGVPGTEVVALDDPLALLAGIWTVDELHDRLERLAAAGAPGPRGRLAASRRGLARRRRCRR